MVKFVRSLDGYNVLYLGTIIGFFRDDKIFIAQRRPEHFFKIFGGFGCSQHVLIELQKRDCKLIRIIYTRKDSGQDVFEATPKMFIDEGKHYVDGHHDAQLILGKTHFNKL